MAIVFFNFWGPSILLSIMALLAYIFSFSIPLPVVVQLLSRVRLFVSPWTAAHWASLSLSVSQSLPKFMSVELVMLSNHLVLMYLMYPCPQIPMPVLVFFWDGFHTRYEVMSLYGFSFVFPWQWLILSAFHVPISLFLYLLWRIFCLGPLFVFNWGICFLHEGVGNPYIF